MTKICLYPDFVRLVAPKKSVYPDFVRLVAPKKNASKKEYVPDFVRLVAPKKGVYPDFVRTVAQKKNIRLGVANRQLASICRCSLDSKFTKLCEVIWEH